MAIRIDLSSQSTSAARRSAHRSSLATPWFGVSSDRPARSTARTPSSVAWSALSTHASTRRAGMASAWGRRRRSWWPPRRPWTTTADGSTSRAWVERSSDFRSEGASRLRPGAASSSGWTRTSRSSANGERARSRAGRTRSTSRSRPASVARFSRTVDSSQAPTWRQARSVTCPCSRPGPVAPAADEVTSRSSRAAGHLGGGDAPRPAVAHLEPRRPPHGLRRRELVGRRGGSGRGGRGHGCAPDTPACPIRAGPRRRRTRQRPRLGGGGHRRRGRPRRSRSLDRRVQGRARPIRARERRERRRRSSRHDSGTTPP